MSKAKPQAKKTQSADAETKKQLAKVKKLITANNADGFALAVELVRALEMHNEKTWILLLKAKTRIKSLSSRLLKKSGNWEPPDCVVG